MAWPCITRVCCLARFWNQFDKSDLSVPLTIQNYSDTGDEEVRSVAKLVSAEQAPGVGYTTPDQRESPAGRQAAGAGRTHRGRPEQSYKPREDYHPPGVPFPSVTQYKQDYKPWPIPKKDNFPWINNGGKGGSPAGSPGNGFSDSATQQRPERSGRLGGEHISSYRKEYPPWPGARPSKPAQKRPNILSTGADNAPPATSYQAAFSKDTHRHTDGVLDTGTHPQQSSRTEVSNKPEEQMKTKLSPNPSAVFQSKSRIFNI